jgi:hypothetical protein
LVLDNNGIEIGIEKTKKKEVKELIDVTSSSDIPVVKSPIQKENKENIKVNRFKKVNILSPLQKKTSKTVYQLDKPNIIINSSINSVKNDTLRRIRPRVQKSLSSFKIDHFDLIFSDLKHEKQLQKTVLLITIFDLIESGDITSHQIGFSENIELQFKFNWEKYLTVNFSKFNVAEAFYYLTREPFWKLIPIKGAESLLKDLNKTVSISISIFQNYITQAKIDPDLFKYLQNELNREHLKSLIVDKYLKNLMT